MTDCIKLHRRDFLRLGLTVGTGLYLGAGIPRSLAGEARGPLQPSVFLALDTEGQLTVWVTRQEMGQGARTVIPMMIAEELDADWSRVKIVQAPMDERYGSQNTGGSLTVRQLWMPLRRAGATARQMLLHVASARTGTPLERLRTENGFVIDRGTGARLPYGQLVAEASRATVPPESQLRLKEPSEFRIIGRTMPRVDGRALVTGKAVFGADVVVPDMLYASFERSPVIGGRVKSVDDKSARKVAGVRQVVPVEGSVSWMTQWANGVAVVAESTWAAMEGRRRLKIEWDLGKWATLDSDEVRKVLQESVGSPGTVTRNDGSFDEVPAGPNVRRVEAEYEAPYLSHSPLEPMNATVSVTKERCDIWAPVQFPAFARAIAAKITGLPPEQVHVQPTLIGGGFGRRIYADYVGEAVMIAKAAGRPVQLLWTRADDTKHGFYRPLSYHRLTGLVSAEGRLLGWRHRIAGPSRDATSDPNTKTPERSEVYTAVEMPYAAANVRVEFHHHYLPLPAGPWRAVSYSQGGYVIESFIDELARAAGADPVAFRLAHLDGEPFSNRETAVEPKRMRRVLEIAAERAGWGKKGEDRGQGVAVTTDHGSVVAHVAEVRCDGADVTVEKFTTVIDCGIAVHPDMVRAQVEGAIAFALSATMWGEITVKEGRVQQSSYADYPVARMRHMPKVDVFIVPSADAPGGVGEPPLPGVAPAIANAIHACTGRRIRALPVVKPPDRRS